MPFRLALSGLNAASTDLSVVANNIANSATTGFKESRAQFAEVYSVSVQGVSATSVGNGVTVSAVSQQFSQGSIETTDNNLDLAISGSGFYVLSDNGARAYTRAGAFTTDDAGYVVNAQGQRLQAYPVTSTGDFNTGSLTDLRLIAADSAPNATTEVEMVMNLPSDAVAPVTTTFDPNDTTSYTKATSLTVYDSLGAAHTATTYFSKVAEDATATPPVAAGTWEVRLNVDGTAVGTAQTLTFDSSGKLTSPANGQTAFGGYTPATGATAMNMTLDFTGATQYGSTFGVNSVTQDGYTTGQLISMDIDSTGIVQARYTNGRSVVLGQVAMANFANPNGLQSNSGTSWSETYASGQAVLGQAGTASLGLIQSGALEASNVDLTEQLVNMITAQRNFQANAQMISTADEITQTIINIR